MRYGPDIFHGLFFVVAGLVWLVVIAALVAILVLLVRFLLVGTKAAKLYIANNSPVVPSEAVIPPSTAPTTPTPPTTPPTTKPRTPKAPPAP